MKRSAALAVLVGLLATGAWAQGEAGDKPEVRSLESRAPLRAQPARPWAMSRHVAGVAACAAWAAGAARCKSRRPPLAGCKARAAARGLGRPTRAKPSA